MDMLEQAKVHLDVATEEFDNGAWDNANRRAQFAQAAALIAIAEELGELNTILHNATDLDGAVKLAQITSYWGDWTR